MEFDSNLFGVTYKVVSKSLVKLSTSGEVLAKYFISPELERKLNEIKNKYSSLDNRRVLAASKAITELGFDK